MQICNRCRIGEDMEFGKFKRNRYNRYDPIPPKPRVRGTGKRKERRFRLRMDGHVGRVSNSFISDGVTYIEQYRYLKNFRFKRSEVCLHCLNSTITLIIISERVASRRCESCGLIDENNSHYYKLLLERSVINNPPYEIVIEMNEFEVSDDLG